MAAPETTQTSPMEDPTLGTDQNNGPDAPSGFILKLFQMVNGAPDEVISWTPNGEAFMIGSDIKRLESETLPKYFRHNRFQSLVRQLNFYSFRKINRERNIWIYKHSLFRRDHPEDLHLVRRRTCPGLDGRKQRFARTVSASGRQETQPESDVESKTDDESVSRGSPSPTCVAAAAATGRALVASTSALTTEFMMPLPSKRVVEIDPSPVPAPKRVRRVFQIEHESIPTEHIPPATDSALMGFTTDDHLEREAFDKGVAVVTSLVDAVCGDDVDDGNVLKSDKYMSVTEVSEQLERVARKAIKNGKSKRRGVSGMVVTTQFGNYLSVSSGSGGLLTYDDEESGYVSDDNNVGPGIATVVSRSADSSVVGEESSLSGDPHSSVDLSKPPVPDSTVVNAIVQRVLAGCAPACRASVATKLVVAGFCMSTAPCGDDSLCTKILQLIGSCGTLLSEFQRYRAALQPEQQEMDRSNPSLSRNHVQQPRLFRPNTVQQIWERTSSRSDAVRDFKIFAVNCMQELVGKPDDSPLMATLMSSSDRTVLEDTASMWQKSVWA